MENLELDAGAVELPEAQPIRYVTYTDDGSLDGCYLQVPPDDHTGCLIVITEDQAAVWVNYRANGLRDGVELAPPALPVSSMPSIAQYVAAVQGMLDAKAQERRYDGILSACTYATSTMEKFRAEGQACVDWRDRVWSLSYNLMDQVQAGELAQPTVAELLAMLPTMEWPV